MFCFNCEEPGHMTDSCPEELRHHDTFLTLTQVLICLALVRFGPNSFSLSKLGESFGNYYWCKFNIHGLLFKLQKRNKSFMTTASNAGKGFWSGCLKIPSIKIPCCKESGVFDALRGLNRCKRSTLTDTWWNVFTCQLGHRKLVWLPNPSSRSSSVVDYQKLLLFLLLLLYLTIATYYILVIVLTKAAPAFFVKCLFFSPFFLVI